MIGTLPFMTLAERYYPEGTKRDEAASSDSDPPKPLSPASAILLLDRHRYTWKSEVWCHKPELRTPEKVEP